MDSRIADALQQMIAAAQEDGAHLVVTSAYRSYERQGVEQLPTVHEGPAIRQMEA